MLSFQGWPSYRISRFDRNLQNNGASEIPLGAKVSYGIVASIGFFGFGLVSWQVATGFFVRYTEILFLS